MMNGLTKQEWRVETLVNVHGWTIESWTDGLARLSHPLADGIIVDPFGHVHRPAA